ncbi:uncharacterized protein DSM5745_05727 [Aspergillus mulundensis]|uniref:D-isomer specific 2-hydroxyacid dehydrogenase NAD-binding domain-containing protein n=1 Tax=Aspergillus mulundensis TaxID=1810919 RepID=A0A3D8RXW8_9EURO|nr:Uncharacterized protein DSM5745_05727 [Aspergillus mulundensis]RDW78875.1 Uncharacterized protein DSM5745_05727 [Aspergillus mulundensis]
MHPTKPFVLFFNPVKFARPFYKQLQQVAHTEVVIPQSRIEFFQDLQDKYRNIFAIYRTSSSGATSSITSRSAASISATMAPASKLEPSNTHWQMALTSSKRLRHHCYNRLRNRGIIVTNPPDPVTDATADLAVFLLGALCQLNPAMASLRAGTFKTGVHVGNDPQNKEEAVRCVRPETIYHNRSPLPAAQAGGAEEVSFENLLRQSDIITMNVPLTARTTHLTGPAELARMKAGVVIVNTARGAIIDETALAEALESGHVGAVGLDVYEREPEIHERLLKQERAMLVPHVGTHTAEALGKMETWAMENLRRAVVGEDLLSPVSEHQGLALSRGVSL